MAVRAILGQQISVVGARTLLGRLAAQFGEPLARPSGAIFRAFPSAEALAAADPSGFPLPARRAQALRALASAITEERVAIGPGADRDETEASLLALPGIGPWTASYVRMRALGDPDVFLPSDFGVKKALAAIDGPVDPDTWKPWRSYATLHLWATLSTQSDHQHRPKENQEP
jgi:AraC family transcriptional regulator of adaptative response / DNA-3-methyladenine glycosylase II